MLGNIIHNGSGGYINVFCHSKSEVSMLKCNHYSKGESMISIAKRALEPRWFGFIDTIEKTIFGRNAVIKL